MKKCIAIFLASMSSLILISQHADFYGDIRVEGKIDILSNLGDSSIFIGSNAGFNDDGNNFNTFIGANSGKLNTSGHENVFHGFGAGRSNTTGTWNTFVGSDAGAGNTTGGQNAFFGMSAGFNNRANLNSFFGALCGLLNNQGQGNSFFGSSTGRENISGNNNSFFGESAGMLNSEGDDNTFIGRDAGTSNMAGNKNTIIGSKANLFFTNLNNATVLGYGAIVDASNMVRIGNGDVTIIEGEVAFSASSDLRLKENIRPVELGIDFINDLRPVQYHRISNKNDDIEMGIIAQDLMDVLKRHMASQSGMVNQNINENDFLSVRYNDLLAPMIKAIQELSTENKILKTDNLTQSARIDQLEAVVDKLTRVIDKLGAFDN